MIWRALSIFALALGVISTSAKEANAQSELVKLVTERQVLMFDIQTAYWSLFNVNEGKSTDLLAAAEGAQTINDALGKFLLLLPNGTAQGEVPGSRAKPEIWTEVEEFNGAAKTLMEANRELIESAQSGDLDAFRQRFEAVAQACIGCHDFKPSEGGKYRYPR